MSSNTTPAPAVKAEQNKHDRVVAMAGEMARRFETHTGVSWIASDWRHESALWAAAWNAALSVQPVPDATPALGVAAPPPGSPLQPAVSAAIPNAKTQARHAIELIADWYEGDDELSRAAHARRATDAELLDVIKGVLRDLANTQAAYMGEKGNNRQRDEIARLKAELKAAKSPQADAVAALNRRLIAANEQIDALQKLLARGMEARSGETEGLAPKGDSPVPSGTRPETAPETTAQTAPQAEPSDAELRAWRERFPAYVYRPQDDCVSLKLKQQEQTR